MEMRVAGAIKLNVLVVVPVDPEDDHLTREAAEILNDRKFIAVISRANIETEIAGKIIPVLKERFPSPAKAMSSKQVLKKIRRFGNIFTFKVVFVLTAMLSILSLIAVWLHTMHVNVFLVVLVLCNRVIVMIRILLSSI